VNIMELDVSAGVVSLRSPVMDQGKIRPVGVGDLSWLGYRLCLECFETLG